MKKHLLTFLLAVLLISNVFTVAAFAYETATQIVQMDDGIYKPDYHLKKEPTRD